MASTLSYKPLCSSTPSVSFLLNPKFKVLLYEVIIIIIIIIIIIFFFAAFKHPIDTKDKNTPLTSSYSDIALDYQTRPVSVEKLFILRGLTSSWQY